MSRSGWPKAGRRKCFRPNLVLWVASGRLTLPQVIVGVQRSVWVGDSDRCLSPGVIRLAYG